jgi:hypothetical protein
MYTPGGRWVPDLMGRVVIPIPCAHMRILVSGPAEAPQQGKASLPT